MSAQAGSRPSGPSVNASPRILLLAKGYQPDPGGIERYSTEMARAYAAAGHRTYVLTQCSASRRVWREGNAIVINVGVGRQHAVFWRMWTLLLAKRRKIAPHFTHATTWRLALPALLSGTAERLALTIHGREVLAAPRLLRPLMGRVLSSARTIAVVSPSVRNLARALVPSSRSHWIVVWNGLSFAPGQLAPKPERARIRIYTFCRLVERKNVATAIEAVRLLMERGAPPFEYVIAGDGPCRTKLEELIRRYQLAERVKILGRISEADIPRLYAESEIFLHPQIAGGSGADIEGFGLTIADAMAFGSAPIVGRDGGPADFVEDGVTGLVVDGRDVEAIAGAVLRLLQGQSDRRAMQTAARAWVTKNLSWRLAAQKILSSCLGMSGDSTRRQGQPNGNQLQAAGDCLGRDRTAASMLLSDWPHRLGLPTS